MQQARVHHHPRNPQAETFATRLEPGDIIEQGDVYDRTDGTWSPCHPNLVGTAVTQGSDMIILRRLPVATFGVCSQG